MSLEFSIINFQFSIQFLINKFKIELEIRNWKLEIVGMLKRLFFYLESAPYSFKTFLIFILSIIFVRLGLESFSSNQSRFFTYTTFPHYFLFFISLFLSLALILYFFTRENIIKISKVAFFGLLFTWIAPIVDLLLSRGKPLFSMGYLLTAPRNFLSYYLTFFGASLEGGVTYGMRVQALLACLAVVFYVFIKTRKWWKASLSFIVTYTLIFFYSVIPAIIAAIMTRKWNFGLVEMLETIFLPRKIFQISLTDVPALFDFEMGLVFFCFVCAQLVLWYFFYSKKKFWAIILCNVRYLRFFLLLFTLFGGLWLGYKTTENSWDFSLFGLGVLLLLAAIIVFTWHFSVVINDIYDLEIDRISPANKNRILVQNIMNLDEYKDMGLIFFILANLAAFILGPMFLSVSLVLSSLCSYIYSAPPLRLRRWPFVGHLNIGLSSLCAVFLGFMVFTENQTFEQFPIKFGLLVILFFTLATHIKDIKDIKGDQENGVLTIFTVLGEKRGKLIAGILVFLSFLFFAVFLGNWLLLLFSLLFGISGFLLTYGKNSKENIVFGLYSIYILLVFLMSV